MENGNWQISTSCRIETHELIAIKFVAVNYVSKPKLKTKFRLNPSTGASEQLGKI